MKRILCTLLTLALILGCAALPALADEQQDLLGTWEIESMSAEGQTLGKAELDANGMSMTLEIRPAGVLYVTMNGETYTYAYDLARHKMTVAMGEMDFTLRGGKLELFFMGGSSTDATREIRITFTKVGGS